MIRKLLVLVGIVLLAVSPIVVQGAAQDFQQIGTKNQEMQKSLAWLTEGLSKLGNHSDAKLKLTKDQKKKILPIFQALIDKKLIRLEVPQNNGQGDRGNNQGQGQRQGQGQGGNNQGGQRMFDPNNPQMQQRLKQMQEQIDFGNKQMDLIDGVLNDAQVKFIDNMDFQAEKYGFVDFQRTFGNNGQGGGNGGTGQGGAQGGGQGNGQGFNQQAFQQIRQKMRAGQELLVKLNNEVLKMLKS